MQKISYALDANACIIGDLLEASFGPEGIEYIGFKGQLSGAVTALPMLQRPLESYWMLYEEKRDSGSERDPGSNQMT